MQIGTDAVVDIAPPPARSSGGAQTDADELSFGDHLDAATPAERTEAEALQLANGDESEPPEQAEEPAPALAVAPSAPPQSAQPALIQIFASYASADAPSGAAASLPLDHTESAPPPPAAAPPFAAPLVQPKSAPGDKSSADGEANTQATAPLGDDGAQHPSPHAQAGDGSAAKAPQAPAAQPAPAQEAPASQAAAPSLIPPPVNGPPPAGGASRSAKASDAAKAPIAPGDAGIVGVDASAKPGVQSKAAPVPAAAQTAPPRENFSLLLAQHEAPQPAPAQSFSSPSVGAAHAAPVSAASDPAGLSAPAAVQVSREIIRRFTGESTRFELRLDPPELGRVEVRLEVSRDHRVTVVVGADSPQALAELSRHARDLEQALQSAGLELAEGGLSFNLSGRSRDRDESSPPEARATLNDADAAAETTAASRSARPLGLQSWRGVRVDLVA